MNKIPLKIREYSSNDYEQVVEFMLALQSYFAELDSTGGIKVFASERDARVYVDKALKDVHEMDGVIFVGEENGNVVGFIQGVIITHDQDVMHNLTHYRGSQGWIGLFFTDPEFRGRGIGKALLDKMKEYFKSKNCQSMHLKVAHNNKIAVGVYTKYGFTPRDIEMAVKI